MGKWAHHWLKLGDRWKLGSAELQTGTRFENQVLAGANRDGKSQEHYTEMQALNFRM